MKEHLIKYSFYSERTAFKLHFFLVPATRKNNDKYSMKDMVCFNFLITILIKLKMILHYH